MDARVLHTRLIALGIGMAIAACGIAGFTRILPSQTIVDTNIDYSYVYSGAKSSSTSFVRAAMRDDSLLMFGSSEFSTPASLIPQVPAATFGEHDYGLNTMLIGEAFDQSLWHAIALGAFTREDVPQNKVVLIVGPGWFVDGGIDSDTFKTRFSYSLYADFCLNTSIPSGVKAYVNGRLSELGVDKTTIDAANGTLVQDKINSAVFGFMDDLKLRKDLIKVRDAGHAWAHDTTAIQKGEPIKPDFYTMRQQAEVDGAAISSTNDWGVEDDFFTQRLEPVLDGAKDSRIGETYTDTPEYGDMDCFLDIADATGVDVLLVISPVLGPYYDYIGISAQTRLSCYNHIRSVAAEHPNVQVADFSHKEYEKYFLYDIVHFGTVGWTDVDEAIYAFVEAGD